MRSIKYIALTIFLSVSTLCALFYGSCTKDTCRTVTCLNYGICGGGSCTCPMKGTGGTGCEIIYRTQYAHVYKGSGRDDTGRAYTDNIFTFVAPTDTPYTKMELTWNNFGPVFINFPLRLTSSSATGSSFTLTSTTVGTTVYTGYGSVNSTSATLTLTSKQMPPADTTARIIVFSDLVRQ